MQDDIRVGISGVGFIGQVHLEALRRNNVSVNGVAEITPERAQEKAAELGIERAYPSFERLLDDPDINVVHIATPNQLHFPQVKAALLAGKHVICDKPLAINTSQSEELVKLAAERKLVNAINFTLRFYPLVQQARHMVQMKELGNLFIIQGSFLQDWLLYETDWNWRLDPQEGGSLRAVADIGSHWLDLITFITGLRVDSVLADIRTIHSSRKKPRDAVETFQGNGNSGSNWIDQPIHTEDYASILLHYSNGISGVLTVSQVSAGRKSRLFFEINGSKQSMAWDSEDPNNLWIGRRDAPNSILMKDPGLLAPEARQTASYPAGHQEGYADAFKIFIAKVYKYIRTGDWDAQPDFPTFADGHYAMQLCEAIGKSAKNGTWVQVAQGEKNWGIFSS